MNYLAHAWLSFNDSAILTGNMISDFVKGKRQYDYPMNIQYGIRLHRAIDTFTDTHEATRQMKSFFQADYRLYAGAFVDIVYDYFLANDITQFKDSTALASFTSNSYQQLSEFSSIFPPAFSSLFPYLQSQDGLSNYQHEWGIEKSFGGLVRRAVYLHESTRAFELFLQHKSSLQSCYNDFFPSLKNHSFHTMNLLLK